jgi:hypothetical protein
VAFRFAVVVEKTAVGRGRKEKEEEEAGKHVLLIKLQARRNGLPTALSCLSDPQGRDEAVAQEGVQK